MLFASLVLNLLLNGFWNITAALPTAGGGSGSGPGTRQPVGTPETIPEKTFITRALVNGDGFPAAQVTHLNGFITHALQFHTTYGFAPITINSFEDVLNHYQALSAQIDRIRIVSHGNDKFLFCPMFNGGSWNYGMHTAYLEALQDSDEQGLRYVIGSTPPPSPTLLDATSTIVSGIRDVNSGVLAPFGLQASGNPTGELLKFFEVVNDFYQVQHGTLVVGNALLTASQKTTLNNSLNLIEASIRGRLIGTTISGTVVTAAHLDALKAAVMAETPVNLGFIGSVQNLSSSALGNIQTALAASPRVENDIRSAFERSGEPLFWGNVGGLVAGLEIFSPASLNLGGTQRDAAFITGDADLNSFATVGSDLNFLAKGGRVTINGVAATPAQRTELRAGLIALSDVIKARIPSTTATVAQLNAFRTALEGLDLNKSALSGWKRMIEPQFVEMTAANQAMNNNFRTKLNHFRGLMKVSDASKIDVRGCLVGKTQSFVTLLRNFWGTSTNKPTVTAPEWFQVFGFNISPRQGTNIYSDIDSLQSSGISAQNITSADITTSASEWQGLIDFDPHYTFISGLFAGTPRNFATLGWRQWQAGGSGAGIPVLRMEARRVDDFHTLNLGQLIERFAVIFEIASGSVPNATVRGRLDQLQPHLVTYKAKSDQVAAGPAAGELPTIATELTTLAGAITGIAGFAAPAVTLPPAGNSLAEIQTSITNIGTHLDTILGTDLNGFFTAITAWTGHANAKLRYYFTIGLPLPLQSSSHPNSIVMRVCGSGSTTEQNAQIAAALKSWMRIQWTGTTAQAAAMNTVIDTLAISTDAQRNAAARWSMVAEDDPSVTPTADAGLSPTQAFRDHLVTKP
jgi:hypothetical protein